MDFFTTDYSYTPEALEVLDIIDKPIVNLINWGLDNANAMQVYNNMFQLAEELLAEDFSLPKDGSLHPYTLEIRKIIENLLDKGFTREFLLCAFRTEINGVFVEATIRRGLEIRKARRREILRKAGKLE